MPAHFLSRLRPPAAVRLLLVLLLGAGVLHAAWQPPALLRDTEERLRDHFIRHALQAASRPETRLTLVDIDEASLAALGPWPWPRARLAELIEILLADYQVRAVALDLVLPEASDAAGDQRLAQLAQHAPLALAAAFDFQPREPALKIGQLPSLSSPPGPAPALPAQGYLANHAGLSRAHCLGNIGYRPDADGVLRRLPWSVAYQGRHYPMLAQALLYCAAAEPPKALPPALSQGQWRLPWRPRSDYSTLSAHRVLAGQAPAELLRGRRVFIGSTALGLADRVATPLESAAPGLLVHAVAASALLDGPPPVPAWPAPLALLWCLLLALSALLLLPRLPAWAALLFLLTSSLAWLALAARPILQGADFPLLSPLLMAFALLVFLSPFEWWLSQRATRRIKALFAHYLAPSVLAQLLGQQRKGGDPLAPRHAEITVLNADLEGYTRLTASLSLEAAAALTREVLDLLTRPVLAAGGTLDKYTGDGLVAFWGAPLPCADAPARALAAAGAIQAALAALNARRAARGLPPLRLRLGIETGPALVGDLGTPFRSTYTAVGDCINLAAKLQDAARHQPQALLIGPGAAAQLPPARLQALPPRVLPGGRAPLAVYTLPTPGA